MFLDALRAAGSLEPLKSHCAVRFHALSGNRNGRWAMTVKDLWRIAFRIADGDAHEVVVDDYHRG